MDEEVAVAVVATDRSGSGSLTEVAEVAAVVVATIGDDELALADDDELALADDDELALADDDELALADDELALESLRGQ